MGQKDFKNLVKAEKWRQAHASSTTRTKITPLNLIYHFRYPTLAEAFFCYLVLVCYTDLFYYTERFCTRDEAWDFDTVVGCIWCCFQLICLAIQSFPFRNTITKVWILKFLHAVGLSRSYLRFLEAEDNTRNKNTRTKTCILLTDTGVADRGARHRVLSASTSAFFILWYFFNMLLYIVLVCPVSPSLQSPAKLSAGNIIRSKF